MSTTGFLLTMSLGGWTYSATDGVDNRFDVVVLKSGPVERTSEQNGDPSLSSWSSGAITNTLPFNSVQSPAKVFDNRRI